MERKLKTTKGRIRALLGEVGDFKSLKGFKAHLQATNNETYTDEQLREMLLENHNQAVLEIQRVNRETRKQTRKGKEVKMGEYLASFTPEEESELIKEKRLDRENRQRINNVPTFNEKFLEFNEPIFMKKCIERIDDYNHRDEFYALRNTFTRKQRRINLFEIDILSLDDIHKALDELYTNQQNTFKISIQFTFIFETNVEGPDGERIIDYWVWRADQNKFFKEAYLVNTKEKLKKLKKSITLGGVYEYCDNLRPTSSHKLIGVISTKFKVFDMGYRIGASIVLPEYILKSNFIYSLSETKFNMCFWIAYATHITKNKRCVKEGKAFYEQFYNKLFTTDYEGFDIYNDLEPFEERFNIGVNIFELNKDNTLTRTRHAENEENYMNLLQYENHFSLISNIDKIEKTSYKCENCGSCWDKNQDLRRHIITCQDFKKEDKFVKYPQIYEPNRNLIKELNDIFNTECDFRYTPFIVFDFESIGVKVDKQLTHSLKVSNRQQVVSVSIYSNVIGYEEEIFIANKDPSILINEMFLKFDDIANVAISMMEEQFEPLFKKINKMKNERQSKMFFRKLMNYITKVPIVGFNSGFYDLNVNITDIMKELYNRCDEKNKIFSIKNGNTYKTISGGNFQFFDIVQYLPPGYSLEAYVKAFNPDGEKKGIFPYDFIDSYEKLNEPIDTLTRHHFYNTLKNKGITNDEWEQFKENKVKLGWTSIMDLMRWYNNLDVKPFLEAIINHRQFFYDLDLDMFKDGFSLPGMSEKAMFSYCFEEFNKRFIKKQLKRNNNTLIFENIDEKLLGYKDQDKKKDNDIYDKKRFITKDKVVDIIKTQNGQCIHCWKQCGDDEWSLDRVDNDYGHNDDNCVLSCIKCNIQRKNEMFYTYNRKKALIRYSYNTPLIYLIDEENKDVFYELKNNICGGPSIVFHREHKVDETHIKRPVYENGEWKEGENGKLVKSIWGDDANALYLGCIGMDMPCGKLEFLPWVFDNDLKKYNEFIKTFYGFVKVDIHTPEELKPYFGEFPPIFKNVEYNEHDVMGDYMKKYYHENDNKKSRKLISSFFGEGILIKSDRLNWLVNKGMVITKIHGYIPCEKGKIFKKFVQKVSDERRKGDIDPKYKIVSDMWKNVGNSAFGRTGMDKSKFGNTVYGNIKAYDKAIGSILFKDANEYGDLFEINKHKRTTEQNIPIQIACSIYDSAKFVMTKYYYDCVDKYISRENYQYCQMDTDSAYIAYAGDNFEALIKPEMREEYERDKHNWFLRNDTKENYMYDLRTPCLFKPEAQLLAIISLSSKSYYGININREKEDKMSCKGTQRRKVKGPDGLWYYYNSEDLINYETYRQVLHEDLKHTVVNKGFRVLNARQMSNELLEGEYVNNNVDEYNKDRAMYKYEIHKTGLTQKYSKRQVMNDGITTVPLNI